jgi:hypothetical protein
MLAEGAFHANYCVFQFVRYARSTIDRMFAWIAKGSAFLSSLICTDVVCYDEDCTRYQCSMLCAVQFSLQIEQTCSVCSYSNWCVIN